jgi:RNA polymerase sigma-70 factor (ECF subfamily)
LHGNEDGFSFPGSINCFHKAVVLQSDSNDMAAHSGQFEVSTGRSDDLDLVRASKNGDVAAFEQLIKRYDSRLLRISQHITHNREDSQDAVQEAFLKAHQHLSKFREDSQFSTWLIRITVNQSLMKVRKQRAVREVSLDEDFQADGDTLPIEVTDWAPNPEQLYWASELRNILIKTLEELRPILRTIFVLRDIEGLSIHQTAEVLNISQAAVKARLWRVRLQLREGLNKYFNEQTTSARAQLSPFDRRTGRLFGLAECLDHSISQPCSMSVARSPHASPTTAAPDFVECGANSA